MSAIGSFVRIGSAELMHCLELARRPSTPASFRWPWQPRVEAAQEAFSKAWRTASREEVEFEGSGYVLASYFLAQASINGVADPFDADAEPLSSVFTAALVARAPMEFPELPKDRLEQFCRAEWPAEAAEMCESIQAAHRFFGDGMARVDTEHPVVFIIS